MKKRVCLVLLSLFILSSCAVYSGENNDLRTLFQNGKSSILGINIRNFNSKDINGNEIIDEGEERGNFINAVERLDEIKNMGINTLHVLPITPTGKLKALGTAGSLYAISGFTEINTQLIDKKSELSPKEQAKYFITEAHKRGIRVIIDLPSCGSYDLFLTNPELFIKDDKMTSIVPTDWTDVRLLNTGDNSNLNQDLINIHKKFIDMVLEVGADGIRADVATIKPYTFWVEIINYARSKDPEFMFLAEASDSWREPPSRYAEFTPYDKLLESGFDGYYGSFFNLKEWNANQFIEHIKFNKKLLSSYSDKKNAIMSFSTHDEISPILIHGEKFSAMIPWLEATLPFNPYSIDGFYSGDSYIYPWANTEAKITETDDDSYFVHRGKLDIFNFSRKPDGKNEFLKENFKRAYKFRLDNEKLVTEGEFVPLKILPKECSEKVFGYEIANPYEKIIVIGNLDFDNSKDRIIVKLPKLKKTEKAEIIHGNNNIRIKPKKISTSLGAGEIIVIKIKKG